MRGAKQRMRRNVGGAPWQALATQIAEFVVDTPQGGARCANVRAEEPDQARADRGARASFVIARLLSLGPREGASVEGIL